MAANTIGTGALILTANADKLVAGLEQSKQRTDKWAQQSEKAAQKSEERWKRAGDAIKFVGAGFAIGQAFNFLGDLSKKLLSTALGFDEMARSAETSLRLIDQLAQATDRRFAKGAAWAEAAGGPAEQIAAQENLLKQAEDIQNGLIKNRNLFRKQIEEMGGALPVDWLAGQLGEKDRVEAQLSKAAELADKGADRVRELQEKLRMLRDPASNPVLAKSINDQAEAYRKQAQAIRDTIAGVDELTAAQSDAARKALVTGEITFEQAHKISDAIAELQRARREQDAVATAKLAAQFAGTFGLLQSATAGKTQLAGAYQTNSAEAYGVLARNFADSVDSGRGRTQDELNREQVRLLGQINAKLGALKQG
jgi:hypothetical protein